MRRRDQMTPDRYASLMYLFSFFSYQQGFTKKIEYNTPLLQLNIEFAFIHIYLYSLAKKNIDLFVFQYERSCL